MTKPVTVLGLSAYYHDAAAAILSDGRIIAAAQEERFTRIKGDPAFPHHAVGFCLEQAGLSENEIDHVVYYENPLVKFERLTTIYHLTAPGSLRSFLKSFPKWLTTNLWLENEIQSELGIGKRIAMGDHHLSHAASAFFPSPFEDAAILTIDGVGEWSTATFGVGRANEVRLLKEIRFPNSVGLLYSAFTHFAGFKINSGEYKLMGLAPYGRPVYAEAIRNKIVHLEPDGAVQLNNRYFDFVGGLTMTNDRFADLFGGPPRRPESPITQREMDLAASIQEVLNEIIERMARYVHRETGLKHLVMAGGVALNVVSTGLLSRSGPFEAIWIQPAAGDAGSALGAALWMWHMVLGKPRVPQASDSMCGGFLGPEIAAHSEEDDQVLSDMGGVWESWPDAELQRRMAGLIAEGKVVAVARGRMEWGPRALGGRSILGDARSPKMQSFMNLKIKFRESFRPFAPMVLVEDANEYFDIAHESPYMLFAFPVAASRRMVPKAEEAALCGLELLNVQRSELPAVTHIDYSSRVQTIDNARNPFIHGLLLEFKRITGCSVVINTSFNVRGEPIVCSAEDAYRCFMATEIDCLVIGNRMFHREHQKAAAFEAAQRRNLVESFEPD
jgi:carbamoyltransferase